MQKLAKEQDLANGLCFHTIDKIVWHILVSTKINKIVKLTNLFGTFWYQLKSTKL
jgi:hypothetical protein